MAVASAGLCASLHLLPDNPPLSFFTGRMPFLPPNQQSQSTEGNSTTWKSQRFNCRTFQGLYEPHTTTLHPFDSRFSRITWVSWYQKNKPFRILMKQEMLGWQWHQLDHMQIIRTSLQTDNHSNIPPLSFFYRPNVLPAAQPTVSKH